MAQPDRTYPVQRTEAEWRQILSPEEYEVLRQRGTERSCSGAYFAEKRPGTYHCRACNQALFESQTKFDSGTGWPNFFKPIQQGRVVELTDRSHGMVRTEVVCSNCGSHLGHVFPDGPKPTGMRYCINSLSLKLEPKAE
ncbi:MAG: peptide-methionine (R)-S-oxide reductase MsrB [Sphingobacteriia bacterium]